MAEIKPPGFKVGCEEVQRESAYLPRSSYLKNRLFIALKIEPGPVRMWHCLKPSPWDARSSLVLPESGGAAPARVVGWAGAVAPVPQRRAGSAASPPAACHICPCGVQSSRAHLQTTGAGVCVCRSSLPARRFPLLRAQLLAIPFLTPLFFLPTHPFFLCVIFSFSPLWGTCQAPLRSSTHWSSSFCQTSSF